MSLTKLELTHTHLILYVENEQGLLFNLFTNSLIRLPKISVALVLLFDQGMPKQDIVSSLSQQTGLSKTQVTDLYQHVFELFEQTGQPSTYAQGQYPELKALINQNHIKTPTQSNNTYLVANASFAIAGPADLVEDLANILAPIKHSLTAVDFALEVVQESDLYHIYANGLLVEQCQTYQEVVPLIIDRLQVLAYQKSDYRFCFHGAALACTSFNLLLPGESGAGKSTLSALLADNNHALYSDEYIVFDQEFNLHVLPLPIAIKSGSWQVVSHKYPQIIQAKTWQRLDGRQLKYLWPDPCTSFSSTKTSKTVFIHPQYSANNTAAEIKELNVIDTLSILTASGYQLGFELNARAVEQLIKFILATKPVRIAYSNTEQISKFLTRFR